MPVEESLVLDTVFGRQMARLRGVTTCEQIALLGRGNLARLVSLAQESVHFLMVEGGSRDELRTVRDGIALLNGFLERNPADKPLLPRLRAENFRKGDSVMVFLGDSPGNLAAHSWVAATITDVAKSYRAEWANGAPNSGYYWRLTATASEPIFPDDNRVVFSTSEPRVIPEEEFRYLTDAVKCDDPFADIYSANAWREWEPLWCLERGVQSSGQAMDMSVWLRQ